MKATRTWGLEEEMNQSKLPMWCRSPHHDQKKEMGKARDRALAAAEDNVINNKPGVEAEGEPSAQSRVFRGWVTGAPESSLPEQEMLEVPSWLPWLGVFLEISIFILLFGSNQKSSLPRSDPPHTLLAPSHPSNPSCSDILEGNFLTFLSITGTLLLFSFVAYGMFFLLNVLLCKLYIHLQIYLLKN